MNQSELEGNTCHGFQAQENAYEQSYYWFWLLFLIGWESGANFITQSQSMNKNQGKR